MDGIELGTRRQSGRGLSAEETCAVRATLVRLPGLAHRELAAVLCEYTNWRRLTGTSKLHACGNLLGRPESAGLLALPAVRPKVRPRWVPLAALP